MEKSLQKSHIVKLCLIALFFIITPLLSSSIRPAYLHLLLNLLIIVIGAEAGLLSFLNPQEDKPIDLTARVITTATELSPIKEVDDQLCGNNYQLPKIVEKKVRKVEKSVSAKVVSAVKVRTLMKSPSTPSLFFIGGGETDEAEETMNEFEGIDGDECLSGQELFAKAENFIGSFYKQLKIQREDSWRKIHDLYHKTF